MPSSVLVRPARRELLGASLGAGALTALTACSGPDEDAAPATGTTRSVDSAHGPVDVPARPRTVVAVSYDTPFQLLAVGVQPAGAFDYSRYYDSFTPEVVEQLKTIPSVGTFGEPDLEAVAALGPDLIVGSADEVDAVLYEQMRQIAPTVLISTPVRGDWATTCTGVAEAAGAANELTAARATYQQTLQDIRSEYAGALAAGRFASFSLGDVPTEFSVQLPNGAAGALLVAAGAPTIAQADTDRQDSGYGSYSLERLSLLSDATVLLCPADADGSTPSSISDITSLEGFRRLPAATAGHVFGLFWLYAVTDYASATNALTEFAQTVLTPLQG